MPTDARFRWDGTTLDTLQAMCDAGATDLEISDRLGCTPDAARRRAEINSFRRGKRRHEPPEPLPEPDALLEHRRQFPHLYAGRSHNSPTTRPHLSHKRTLGLSDPLPPSRTCCWINGDVSQPGWSYCGRRSVRGHSWCAEHFRTVVLVRKAEAAA